MPCDLIGCMKGIFLILPSRDSCHKSLLLPPRMQNDSPNKIWNRLYYLDLICNKVVKKKRTIVCVVLTIQEKVLFVDAKTNSGSYHCRMMVQHSSGKECCI